MERIGIAASKMAKGNLFQYNLFVFLIALGCSLLLFIIVGATILFALIILAYMGDEIVHSGFRQQWRSIFSVCMVTLTVIMTVFYLLALAKNIKISLPGK